MFDWLCSGSFTVLGAFADACWKSPQMCHFRVYKHKLTFFGQLNKHSSLDRSGLVHAFSLCDLGAGRAFCGAVDKPQASSPEASQLSGHTSLLTQVVGTSTPPGSFTPFMLLIRLSCAGGPLSGPRDKTDPYLQQMFWVTECSILVPRVSCSVGHDQLCSCYLSKMSSLATWCSETDAVMEWI